MFSERRSRNTDVSIAEALREAHFSDVRVLASGIISEQDFATLEQSGVHS